MRGQQLLDWVRQQNLRFVRLAWVDNGGALRAQAVSARRLQDLAEEGLGIVTAVQAISIGGGMVPVGHGLGPVGQVWLVPAAETARVLPWEPTHGSVMGSFVDREGAPWPFCPRGVLTRAMQALAEVDLSVQAAFEHEFVLLRRDAEGITHFESSHYASAHGLDHAGAVLDDIAEALEDQGLGVRTMLKEGGPSQFEISTDHGSAMEAADRFIAVRETIGAVAARHSLLGTCLPLVFAGEAGNGWHLHFSLWRDGQNLTGRGNSFGSDAQSFVAGVFHHLPALMALSTPTPNSFRRIRPGAWCGAYQVWGYDHKEAPLRVPTERHGAPTNVELKSSDATANPYLSMAAVIAAGLDGLRRGLALPEPIDRDPATLSDDEREARGIAALPRTLGEALNHLEADPVLIAALGEDLAAAYVGVKRDEEARFADLTLEDEVGRLLESY